jgi:predicted negative regulator of RcsB-dependent stress response
VSEMRTEEEQVEAIKSWWKENGKSLMLSIVVAVAAVFGWRGWQANQDAYAANASALYENLSSTVESVPALDEAQAASVIHLGKQLKDEYGSSVYSPMAAMLLAKVYVSQGDLAAAVTELEYVVANEEAKPSLVDLAKLRKVQLLISQGELSQAPVLLNQVSPETYASLYHELKGDLAFAQGDAEAARSEYELAMDQSDPQTRSLIQMKFDDLASGES